MQTVPSDFINNIVLVWVLFCCFACLFVYIASVLFDYYYAYEIIFAGEGLLYIGIGEQENLTSTSCV